MIKFLEKCKLLNYNIKTCSSDITYKYPIWYHPTLTSFKIISIPGTYLKLELSDTLCSIITGTQSVN